MQFSLRKTGGSRRHQRSVTATAARRAAATAGRRCGSRCACGLALPIANLEEAANRGVFGAPFYITDGDERFWGQDRLDDLDLHLSGKL